jgi:hypothetical protein
VKMLASPMLAGGRRKSKGKGKSIHLSTLHEGFWMEFPMLAGGERGRERKEKQDSDFSSPRSLGHPPYTPEVSVAGSLELACPKMLPANFTAWTSCRVPQCPTSLQRASLFHPCMRAPRWDADPKCQPNY